MARPAEDRDARAMVELKAVDGTYPLVGDLDLTPAIPLAEALERRDGVWGAIAEQNLLDRLGIEVGDRVKVGDAVLHIRARLDREPDRVASVFNFGPRLMITDDALPETGLVRPGSMIRFHTRLTLRGLPPGSRPGPTRSTSGFPRPAGGCRTPRRPRPASACSWSA